MTGMFEETSSGRDERMDAGDVHNRMDRIIVLGAGGAGKSTLARKIGELLDIEVIHLDSYYWRPNWVATPDGEWTDKVKELLKRERWVMDGNYTSSLELRLKAADAVIFLDRSRLFCLWQVFKRLMKYSGEFPPGAGGRMQGKNRPGFSELDMAISQRCETQN